MKKNILRLTRGMAGLLIAALALVQSISAANFTVTFTNFTFIPKIISVNVGDTITWVEANTGGIPHTVTGTGAEAMCGSTTFTTTGSGCSHTFMNAGSFPYQCNFHFQSFGMTGLVNVASVVVPPPTVSISSPTNGAVFAALANVSIIATATAGGGTVTNVSFFAGTNALGSVTASPFTLRSGNLAAGEYALTAVASAGGVSATSAVVNITAVTPLPLSVTTPGITNGQFSFSYASNPGLTYLIQDSLDFSTWVALSTNVATGNPSAFTDAINTNTQRFYRVGLLPNP